MSKATKSAVTATSQPAKGSKPTSKKGEEIKPVTIFANPKTEAEMKAAKKKPKADALETGKCYRFEKGDDVFYGKVTFAGYATLDIKIFRNGEHSNVQTFDRKGLTAQEVSAQAAYNCSLTPDHNGG